MSKLELHFDFVSPNAYLAHAALAAVEGRVGSPFTRIPVLLGGIFKATGNKAPLEAFGSVHNKMAYMRTEMDRFVRRYDVPFQWNPFFPINSVTLMRGSIAAQDLGVFERYVDGVYQHMWAKGSNLNDPAVVQQVLSGLDIDAGALMELAQSPSVKQRLVDNTELSVARGSFGCPTFFVGDEMFFGKDSLRDVEDACRGH